MNLLRSPGLAATLSHPMGEGLAAGGNARLRAKYPSRLRR